MKTEWTQEPHTTVRWALFEALRGADKASTVDYWDVVTENLIQGLDLYQAWTFLHSVFNSAGDLYASQEAARAASEHYGPEWHLASRLTSDWKRVDSND